MGLIGFLLYLLIIGLVAGALARLLVPGPDPMSLGMTWLLGVIGSFVGGFLGKLLFNNDAEDGWFQAAGPYAARPIRGYRAKVRGPRRDATAR